MTDASAIATQTGSSQTPERTISAVFKQREQIDQIVRQLIDHGISRDHISVIGKNFHSETRIAGFITKRDVILGGLKQGAAFGSFFGSILGLLTGVGVLFVPFIGTIVAAGPIGALLLGAASGALAGSAGAGLVSAFVAIGLPEDKAAVYQTRVEAGEFLLMVEVPAAQVDEVQSLLETGHGEEISTLQSALPRQRQGALEDVNHLPPEVRSHLASDAQADFLERYNAVLDATNDEEKAERAAWDLIHQRYEEDDHGVWSKQKASAPI